MGQKTRPIILRQNINYPLWGKNFISEYILREYIIQYFYRKGFLINELYLSIESNILYIDFEFVVSRSSKIYTRRFRKNLKRNLQRKKKGYIPRKFKRKFCLGKRIPFYYPDYQFKYQNHYALVRLYKKKKRIILRKNFGNSFFLAKKKTQRMSFYKFLKILATMFNVGRVFLRAKRLDHKINIRLYNHLLAVCDANDFGLKRRQKNKNIKDLLILSTFFLENRVKVHLILRTLAKHFKWVPKRQQKTFLTFVRDFFESLFQVDMEYRKYIHGIKFVVTGRINGKTEAGKFLSITGQMFSQTLKIDIDYDSRTTFSRLGTYGWKMWVAKNLKEEDKYVC